MSIGPSALHWRGDALQVQIDEVAVPWPSRLRGSLRLSPQVCLDEPHALDAGQQHHWRPIAPRARIEVDLPQPGLRWQGDAYFDSNFGVRPLEADFERWHWSRASLSAKRSAVLYDVTRSDGSAHSLALHFDAHGGSERFDAPPPAALPRSGWRVERATRSETPATVQRTLEDGPFYARSLLRAQLLGEPVLAMHESLSMRRFVSPWVQAMLPFRMPRRPG